MNAYLVDCAQVYVQKFFEFEDDGKAGVKVDGIEKKVLDSAREAEENCPTNVFQY